MFIGLRGYGFASLSKVKIKTVIDEIIVIPYVIRVTRPAIIWFTDTFRAETVRMRQNMASPEGEAMRHSYESHLAELKRLYHLQEEAKAKARFKVEQARKEQIPYSEQLAIEICQRVGLGNS
jgi:hypothetical protein